MKQQLIYPMALYVFSLWCLTVFMFRARVRWIKSNREGAKYFKAYLGEPPPERTLIVGQHYDNQFQVPILFLVTAATHLTMGSVNLLTVVLAWIFVISRAAHSWVHLGRNKLQYRVSAFAVGWITILIMWAQLLFFVLRNINL